MTGNDLLLIIQVLISMESSGRDYVKNGDAWGCLQLRPIYIQDVNENYGTSYTHQDAMTRKTARGIAIRYLSFRMPKNATPEQVFLTHRFGPSGHKRGSTSYSREAMRRLNDHSHSK